VRGGVPIGADFSQFGAVALDLVGDAAAAAADKVAADVDLVVVPELAVDGAGGLVAVIVQGRFVNGGHGHHLGIASAAVGDLE
jgi:hypothetical protein